MWANLYFGLKYAHLGSNIVWTFMFFGESNGCGQVLIAIIASIHGVISVIGLITFVVLKILRKTTCTAKCWKYIISISIICMLFCYLLCILELLVPLKCQKASYFINSYKIYGLIELVSPILLLIFLKTEVGDPRDHIVKKKEEVFAKWRENPNITDE